MNTLSQHIECKVSLSHGLLDEYFLHQLPSFIAYVLVLLFNKIQNVSWLHVKYNHVNSKH